MTDLKLLELAAKAAGIQLLQWVGKGCWSSEEDEEGFQTAPPEMDRWNPLTDDGDALRLAVKLNIDIDNMTDACYAEGQYGHDAFVDICDCGGDPYAAARRAIVRAAAEIGKEMK
jgi:hypothetical protein